MSYQFELMRKVTMAEGTAPKTEHRVPWTRAQLLSAAIDLADQRGIESLSMRKLSQELGGGTMSLYNHVSNKDDLLDGMIDTVFSEVELPANEEGWKAAMRQRAISMRAAMTRHPWAIGLMESRRTLDPRHFGTMTPSSDASLTPGSRLS